MTSVVGVYLLSGSACLVHMWVSVCVCKRVQWGGGWSREEMSSLACAPNALADQGEKERFVSNLRSLKSELFSTDLQPCAPGKETITLPLNRHRAQKKWLLR